MSCNMNNNNRNNENKSICVAIEKAKAENLSTGHSVIEIGKVSFKGFVLEDFKATAHLECTDENCRIETDAAMDFLHTIVGTFSESLINMMKAKTENIRARKDVIEQEIKTEAERTAREEAEKKYYEAKCREVEREAQIKFENLNKNKAE